MAAVKPAPGNLCDGLTSYAFATWVPRPGR